MILADDNFTTIVSAVEEGRNIYNNTKQFIRYLICSNIGEVVAIFVVSMLGLPDVLLPVQLLWVNLVTDGLPAVALGFNKPEDGIMEQQPRPRDEPVVSGWSLVRYIIGGLYIGCATISGMLWWFTTYANGPKLDFYQLSHWHTCTADSFPPSSGLNCDVFHLTGAGTVSLSILVTIEMFCAFNSLSERHSLISRHSHPFSNPYLLLAQLTSFGLHFLILYVPFLAKLFSVSPIGWEEWMYVIAVSFPIILIDEVLKFIDRNLLSSKKPKQE